MQRIVVGIRAAVPIYGRVSIQTRRFMNFPRPKKPSRVRAVERNHLNEIVLLPRSIIDRIAKIIIDNDDRSWSDHSSALIENSIFAGKNSEMPIDLFFAIREARMRWNDWTASRLIKSFDLMTSTSEKRQLVSGWIRGGESEKGGRGDPRKGIQGDQFECYEPKSAHSFD